MNALAFLFLSMAASVPVQTPYDITRASFTGGGGHTDGSHRVHVTLGDPLAGGPSRSGSYSVMGGFLTVLATGSNRDTTPPVIECPRDITHWTCDMEAIINYSVTATDDMDTNVSVVCTPPSGSPFPLGTSTVTCVATDDAGNTSRCSFQVMVLRDTSPPIFICPSNWTVRTCGATAVVDYTVAAIDQSGVEVPVTCTLPSGSSFPLGTTTVTCVADDDCGNTSTCDFTVTVLRDTTPPIIQCPADMTLFTSTDSAVVRYNVVAADDSGGEATLVCTPPSGSVLPLGLTTVRCVATDPCGNSATCTFDVRVIQPRIDSTTVSNAFVLTWPEGGVLETADQVEGPWREFADARSPHQVHPTRGQQFYRLRFDSISAPDSATPTFSARSEENLGIFNPNPDGPWLMSDASIGAWRATRGDQWTNIRGGTGKVAANFLVEGDQVPVSILFSAETYVRPEDKRLFARLIVDGQPMDPVDIVLANGRTQQTQAARAFEFTGKFNRGLHTVEAQWRVDAEGQGYIRDAALLIRQGDLGDSRAALIAITPSSGPNIETSSDAWQQVPGLSTTVTADERDCVTVTVSAEAYAAGDESLMMRVLIDGAVADPGEVRFVSGGFEGSRCMAFGLGNIPGTHTVEVEFRSGTGGTVGLGDRTLVVSIADNANSSPIRKWFRSAGNEVVAQVKFTEVPDMDVFAILPADTDVSVIFSAEFLDPNPGLTSARLTVGGLPVPGSEILLTDGDSRAGVHSFTFDAKHINPEDTAVAETIAVEWKTEPGLLARMGKRSMVVYAKQHAVPDLAEGPLLGGAYDPGDGVRNLPIEPMFGTKHVLVILLEPKGLPEPVPSISELESAFFGPNNSVADYYDKVSGGRLVLKNAGVMGPYETDLDWSFYYEGPGDHQDTWVEAVTKAEFDGFAYSDYDFDGDGYISSFNELAIVIVKPQSVGDGFKRSLWSNDIAKKRDGVFLDTITEWYTSDPTGGSATAIHELGHQIFQLADLYAKDEDGVQVGTRPGIFALMDQGGSPIKQHLNPFHKLALGWITPRILTEGAGIELEDIKVSREAVVLPRIPSVNGDEYLVIENRPSPSSTALYDFGIPDSGLALWQIIESPDDSDNPPSCTGFMFWAAQTGLESPRAGIRLIRPRVDYGDGNALWDSTQYDLDEFGLSCPPDDPHNVLLWSDGTPSYELRNFSPAGAVMTFDVVAP